MVLKIWTPPRHSPPNLFQRAMIPDSRLIKGIKLALIGYGKMGKAIAQLAPNRGAEIRLVLTSESNRNGTGINAESLKGIDVAIEFTNPATAADNIRRLAGLGCNLVVGTTGWTSGLDEIRNVVESSGVGMVYAANFSIGVQLFYQAARSAAQIFAKFPLYEPYITEAHHRFKKDMPSGTALELKRQIQPELTDQEIQVSSIRAGYIPGTHELGFDSEGDTVILRHTARSRQGFAEGALYAAKWVVGKKGLFTFGDVLEQQG
jgi:4-hydroxy-tetrahydrodipicolinate reductase